MQLVVHRCKIYSTKVPSDEHQTRDRIILLQIPWGFQHKAVKCIANKNIKDNTFQKPAWVARAQCHDDTLLFRQSAQIYNQTQGNAYSLLNARLGNIIIYKSTKLAKSDTWV